MSEDAKTSTVLGVEMTLTAFGGHCYLVEQCVVGDDIGDGYRAKDGVAMCKPHNDRTDVFKVVGIGPNVGKPADKTHRRKYGLSDPTTDTKKHVDMRRPLCYNAVAKMGDLVICQRAGSGVRKAPWCDYMFFMEESCLLAVLETEDE